MDQAIDPDLKFTINVCEVAMGEIVVCKNVNELDPFC